jgi:hypothetical protein
VARRIPSLVVSGALFSALVAGIFLAFAGAAWGRILAYFAFAAVVAWEMTREAAGWRRSAELKIRIRQAAARRRAATPGKEVGPLSHRSRRAIHATETLDEGTLIMGVLLALTSLGLLWVVLELLL